MYRSLRHLGLASLFLLLVTAPLSASLVLVSPEETSGTGLGAVNTVLTVQNDPTESGCVGFDGTSDVVGPAACPPGIPGGDETASNQTRTIGELGIDSAFNLRVVFNFNEDNEDAIDLEDLVLSIFAPDGTLLFSSEPFTPVTFPEPFSGTGTAGFVFRLDAAQALEANAFFDDPNNRIGLAAELGRSSAGPETFFVGNALTLGGPAADLSLEKTDSPDPVAIGATLTYTLTVDNLGPNTATDVVVSDTLPSSVIFISATASQGTCSADGRVVTCELGDLASGASATITIEVTTTSDGQITNNAVVVSDTVDPDTSNNAASEETTVGVGSLAQVDLAVTKTDSPDPVVVDSRLEYTLAVSNAGPDDATGVTLTDVLPSSVDDVTTDSADAICSISGRTVTCEFGTVAAGTTETVTITVTPREPGRISDSATVSADESDANPDDNSTEEETRVVEVAPDAAADLNLSKTDSEDPVAPGGTLVYTVEVLNEGPDTATGVVVTDDLPTGVTFVSATPEQGSCSESGGVVTCDLASIASGEQVEILITVEAPATPGVVLTNRANVTSDIPDPDPNDNDAVEQTEVEPQTGLSADVRARKSDAPDPVAAGAQLTYTVVVTNGGPDPASGVTLKDDLPAGATFFSATPSTGSCTGTDPVVCDLGTLAASASASVEIVVDVGSDTSGTLTNTAVVEAAELDPNTDNNVAVEQTEVSGGAAAATAAPDLTLTKTDSPDPVTVGAILTYTLTVGNAGVVSATDVELVDILPASIIFSEATASPGSCSESMGVVICSLGSLAPGGTATVTITGIVTMEGTILNTAGVSAQEAEADASDNVAEEETTVGPPHGGDVLAIPTASETGLALLALLLALAGSLALLRRA